MELLGVGRQPPVEFLEILSGSRSMFGGVLASLLVAPPVARIARSRRGALGCEVPVWALREDLLLVPRRNSAGRFESCAKRATGFLGASFDTGCS